MLTPQAERDVLQVTHVLASNAVRFGRTSEDLLLARDKGRM